jgi:acetyl esterase/lipase
MAPLVFSGRYSYRLRNLVDLLWWSAAVAVRRLVRGPRRPGWSWTLESSSAFLRVQMAVAFDIADKTGDIAASREYANALCFALQALASMTLEPVTRPVKGLWYTPRAGGRDLILLYLHGGGYAYYSKLHGNFIALVALAAEARTFALEYRLIPEHPFPAQLEDALTAYRWLLAQGVNPRRLVVAGDSAGGNLTLALLLALRRDGLPQPLLAYGLCPWTDVGNSGASMTSNAAEDWVHPRMAAAWAKQLCAGGADPRDPLVSPLHADLRGLAPIYLQAGGAEILLDMIRDFHARAQAQGADVALDVWEHMPHDFQAYGDLVPDARQALQRFREKLDERLRET